ncbi:MAG: helix-turn-helix domain-containing protein [Alphaproteobacteria bacterium]|nr:helix-turn-helix domain-containing protein [Alphaproteobacteria bacterium]
MSVRLAHRVDFDDGETAGWMAEFAPSPALSPILRSYAFYEERTFGFTTRRQPPHGDGVFILNFADPIIITDGAGVETIVRAGEGFVAGPHLRPAFVRSTGAQSGMHLHMSLLAQARLLRIPMAQLKDSVVAIDALLGPAAARAMADCAGDPAAGAARFDAIAQRLLDDSEIDSRLEAGVALLQARPDLDIAAIASCIGWSRKRFTEVARETLGVGPRAFRRLLRFNAAAEALRRKTYASLADLAAACGYADQAHMNREFKEFAELTPAETARRMTGQFSGIVEA